VVDGEIIALADDARPVFSLLQNFTSESGRIRYFVFVLLCYKTCTGNAFARNLRRVRSPETPSPVPALALGVGNAKRSRLRRLRRRRLWLFYGRHYLLALNRTLDCDDTAGELLRLACGSPPQSLCNCANAYTAPGSTPAMSAGVCGPSTQGMAFRYS
jgi:hypothetical protein